MMLMLMMLTFISLALISLDGNTMLVSFTNAITISFRLLHEALPAPPRLVTQLRRRT
jgi:hypothetical protein